MKKDRLDKFYPSFTGEERFRLHLEALYRRDEAEVKRLVESCPRESYVKHEAAFSYRSMASREIVCMLSFTLAPLLAKLEIMESFRKTFTHVPKMYSIAARSGYLEGDQAGSKRAWEAAGKTGNPPAWKERKEGDEADKEPGVDREMQYPGSITNRLEKVNGEVVGALEDRERELVKEALTTWIAFADCCNEECGVEPEKLVKVWLAPMMPEIEKLKGYLGSTELNPKLLEEYKALFKEIWSGFARLD